MKMLAQLAVILALIASAACAKSCERDGWFEFRDSRYFFNKNFQTWFNSSKECRQLGARLVTVNDAEENNFLVGIMQSMHMARHFAIRTERVNIYNYYYYNYYSGFGGSVTWIGLNDLHHEGLWQWVDTSDFLSYSYWDNSQPDNGYYYMYGYGNNCNGENCAHFGNSLSTMRWGDKNCYLLGTSICEMKK